VQGAALGDGKWRQPQVFRVVVMPVLGGVGNISFETGFPALLAILGPTKYCLINLFLAYPTT
jgi:hypothetical protein